MKRIEHKYFNKEKTFYLLMNSTSFSGCFDKDNNRIDEYLGQKIDMYKVRINKNIYLIRILNRKGIGLVFEISNSDIDLSNPKVFMCISEKGKPYLDHWKEIDDCFKCLLESD